LGRPVEKIEEVDSKLSELLEYILENTDIKRLRISSLGPEFVDEKLLKIFEEKRIYPHFHFSVQSGSTNVLNNMKRHYSAEFLKDILFRLRNIKRED
jgi:tRNA A37 methylthiotransferase MiaB